MKIAKTIKIDKINITILCPICNKIHVHGRGSGSRGQHCKDSKNRFEEYYVQDTDECNITESI